MHGSPPDREVLKTFGAIVSTGWCPAAARTDLYIWGARSVRPGRSPAMPSDRYEQQRNALIQAKVDRAVARWEGLAPPHMIAKMREIAEDYYRTHPFAVRVIDLLVQPHTRDAS